MAQGALVVAGCAVRLAGPMDDKWRLDIVPRAGERAMELMADSGTCKRMARYEDRALTLPLAVGLSQRQTSSGGRMLCAWLPTLTPTTWALAARRSAASLRMQCILEHGTRARARVRTLGAP